MLSTKSILLKSSLFNVPKYFASKELLFATNARKKLLDGCTQLA